MKKILSIIAFAVAVLFSSCCSQEKKDSSQQSDKDRIAELEHQNAILEKDVENYQFWLEELNNEVLDLERQLDECSQQNSK